MHDSIPPDTLQVNPHVRQSHLMHIGQPMNDSIPPDTLQVNLHVRQSHLMHIGQPVMILLHLTHIQPTCETVSLNAHRSAHTWDRPTWGYPTWHTLQVILHVRLSHLTHFRSSYMWYRPTWHFRSSYMWDSPTWHTLQVNLHEIFPLDTACLTDRSAHTWDCPPWHTLQVTLHVRPSQLTHKSTYMRFSHLTLQVDWQVSPHFRLTYLTHASGSLTAETVSS